MPFYSDTVLEEVRSRSPIEEVISEYVALKPKGGRFLGLCPFHNEKTPSFSVDVNEQLYYCFGCHKGGSVFTFIMEQERLEFGEAVRFLAERAHYTLPETDTRSFTPRATEEEKERLYEANREAARFFHSLLWTDEGAQQLSYLYKRGLNDSDIRRNGLGASPKSSMALTKHLKELGYDESELIKAGLLGERDGRTYEMFRDRVMFPIIDARGRVLGFGGRAMGDAQPKYLNTADTVIFNKRNGLYAINTAKNERDAGRLVLVEGYMDVVSLRKYGVKAVVATLGTALTNEQAKLMKRYAGEVWISYDGDSAGQHAALRALDILDDAGLNTKVLDYPKGMDPDDFIKANGLEGFNALKKLDGVSYRLTRAKDDIDISTLDGMTEYTRRACEILRNIKSPVELENRLRALENETGYSREVLIKQIGYSRETVSTLRTPRRREERRMKADPVEGMLIRLLDQGLISGVIQPEDFDSELNARCARHIIGGGKANSFIETLGEEERTKLMADMNADPAEINDYESAMKTVLDCREKIHQRRKKRRIDEIRHLISLNPENREELLQEMIRLQDKDAN